MPLTISSKPITQQFYLKSDPTGETMVVIRQATVGGEQERAELLANVAFVMTLDQGRQEVRQRINVIEQMKLDVFLTLSDCNMLNEHGEPLFKFNDGKLRTRAEFDKAWDMIPSSVAREIHGYAMKVNPEWDPDTRGEYPSLE